MNTVLDKIAAYKREEVNAAKKARPLRGLMIDAREAPAPRGFRAALESAREAKKPGLIAEIKKASPGQGVIRADFDPEKLARSLERGGATCLSVLTDSPSFQGDPEDLMAARQATHLPVLRKDFMLEPYQIVQSRALGADCVLVIMAMVKDDAAAKLLGAAREWGMDAIIEVHDGNELDRALQFETGLIGINNRDLKTFQVNLNIAHDLASRIPNHILRIAESGIDCGADIRELHGSGYQAFLIGETLMRADDPGQKLQQLLQDAGPCTPYTSTAVPWRGTVQ